MAAYETISGIAKVATGVYEITALVNIGAGIDNVSDSVFIQKDGGLLRFTTGHSTTYTNCLFIETETAYRLGADNKNNSSVSTNAPRFNGNSTCAPIFKGCRWIIYPDAGDPYGHDSHFDIGSSDFTNLNGVSPSFISSDSGVPCTIRNVSTWNNIHVATANIVIDGLIIDSSAQIAGELLHKTVTEINKLVFINNLGASLLRHVTFWNPGGTRFKGLSVRSLSIVGSGILYLIDPLGVVAKLDSSWTTGPVQALRTYKTAAIDAVTKASVDSTLVITDAADVVQYDTALTSGLFTGELLHYYQDHGSIAINYSNEYRRAMVLFGYYPAVTPLTIENRPEGSPVDEGKVLLFPDAGVTAASQASVLAFTELETAQKLYDAIHVFQITRPDRHNAGEEIAASAGSQIDFGANSLVVTSAAPSGYPMEISGSTITAYTDGNGFDVIGKFDKLIATTITFSQASVVPSSCTLDADVILEEAGTLSNITVLGNLELSDNSEPFIANGCSITTMTNTSGGSVIVQTGSGTTIDTLPDPSEDITIESAPVTITVTIIDEDTELAVPEAKLYMSATTGGSLTAGTAILGPEVAGVDGVVTGTLAITSDQPFEALVVESVDPVVYYPKRFIGIISAATGYSNTIGLSRD